MDFHILRLFGNAGLQFGGLHQGGLVDPAVCMAFPGYVGQSQVGFGNSEITWYVYYLITNVIPQEFLCCYLKHVEALGRWTFE